MQDTSGTRFDVPAGRGRPAGPVAAAPFRRRPGTSFQSGTTRMRNTSTTLDRHAAAIAAASA
jgi:hypothetical protein